MMRVALVGLSLLLASCAAKGPAIYKGSGSGGGISINALKVNQVDLKSLKWTEVELSAHNGTDKNLFFDPSSVYLLTKTDEQFNAYTAIEVNNKILLGLPLFQASDLIPYYGLFSVIKRASAHQEVRKHITERQFRPGDILPGARRQGLIFYDSVVAPDRLVILIERRAGGDLAVTRITAKVPGICGGKYQAEIEQSAGEAEHLKIIVPLAIQ